MKLMDTWLWLVIVTGLCVLGGCAGNSPFGIFADSTKHCAEMVLHGDIQTVAKTREQRFLGKVPESTARCLGGKRAEKRVIVDYTQYRCLGYLDDECVWHREPTREKIEHVVAWRSLKRIAES